MQKLCLMTVQCLVSFIVASYSVDRGGSDELSFNSVLHKNYNS